MKEYTALKQFRFQKNVIKKGGKVKMGEAKAKQYLAAKYIAKLEK